MTWQPLNLPSSPCIVPYYPCSNSAGLFQPLPKITLPKNGRKNNHSLFSNFIQNVSIAGVKGYSDKPPKILCK